MRRVVPEWTLPVALALCCLLAGCNTFASGGDGPGGSPTVTPAEVPGETATPQTGERRIAPGLTEVGITDADVLADAHRSVVDDRSVTVERRLVETYENRVVSNVSEVVRRGADGAVGFDATVSGDAITRLDEYDVWSTDDGSIERRVVDGQVRYDDTPTASVVRGYVETRLDTLRAVLERVDVTDVTRLPERDGHAMYRLSGDDPTAQTAPASGAAETLAAVTIDVDERGFVSSLRIRTTGRRPTDTVDGVDPEAAGAGVTVTRIETIRFDRVGETPLAPPAWVSDARETVENREYVAPGVTSDRVVDRQRLEAAARRVAENTSLATTTATTEYRNGSVASNTETTVVTNRTTGHALLRQRSGNLTTTSWSNGTVGYRRWVGGDWTRYERHGDPSDQRWATGQQVPRLPGYVGFGVTTVSALDDGRYRVVATEVPSDRAPDTVYERVSFVVDDRGFLTEYESVLVDEAEGRRTVERLVVREVGSTTVERPDWVAVAANETA